MKPQLLSRRTAMARMKRKGSEPTPWAPPCRLLTSPHLFSFSMATNVCPWPQRPQQPTAMILRLTLAFWLLISQAQGAAESQGLGRVGQFQDELQQRVTGDEAFASPPGCSMDPLDLWVTDPGPQVCGHWQTNYAALQRRIRGRGEEQRYLTFVDLHSKMPPVFPRPGLGDFLLGMVSSFLAALLTERAFVMEDSPLTRVVDPSTIDWRLADDVPIADMDMPFYNWGKMGPDGWKDSVKFPVDILGVFGGKEDKKNIAVGANGGVLAKLFLHKNTSTYKALHRLGLRLPTAFGCILRYLIRPKSAVLDMIREQASVLLQPKTSAVGIHMRTTDTFAWKGEGPSLHEMFLYTNKTMLKCAQVTSAFSIPSGHKVVWLFLSDSAALRDAVKSNFSELVMDTKLQPLHPNFRKDFMASVLAEWVLLSLCQNFVIAESGFSKTAAAFNTRSPRIFVLGHFLFSGTRGPCEQNRPTSLLEFTGWSGL